MVIYPNLPPHSSFSKNWANHKKIFSIIILPLNIFNRKYFTSGAKFWFMYCLSHINHSPPAISWIHFGINAYGGSWKINSMEIYTTPFLFHSTLKSVRAPFAMAALTTKIIAIVPNKLSTDRDLNGIVKNYTGTKYCEIYREASPQTADDIRDPCIEFSIWHLFFQSKHWRGRRGAVEMISNFFCDQNLSLNGVELFSLKMARWYLSVIWNTTQWWGF